MEIKPANPDTSHPAADGSDDPAGQAKVRANISDESFTGSGTRKEGNGAYPAAKSSAPASALPDHPAPAPDLPKPAPPDEDDFDLDALIAPPEPELVVEEVLTRIPLRGPRKDELIRVRLAAEFSVDMLQFRLDDGEVFGDESRYLVAPVMESVFRLEFGRDLARVTLRMAITERGKVFLWPIESQSASGRRQAASASRRAAAAAAEKEWVFVFWNSGEFRVRRLRNEVDRERLGEPKWPNLTVKEVCKMAFGELLITDNDHEIVRQLRGGRKV
jgi:hypothetical protein